MLDKRVATVVVELLIILRSSLRTAFSGAEMAIVASRRGRLRSLADGGNAAAEKAFALANNPNRFLPTVQIGITLVATLAAAYGGDRVVSDLSQWILRDGPSSLKPYAQSLSLTAFVLVFHSLRLYLENLSRSVWLFEVQKKWPAPSHR